MNRTVPIAALFCCLLWQMNVPAAVPDSQPRPDAGPAFGKRADGTPVPPRQLSLTSAKSLSVSGFHRVADVDLVFAGNWVADQDWYGSVTLAGDDTLSVAGIESDKPGSTERVTNPDGLVIYDSHQPRINSIAFEMIDESNAAWQDAGAANPEGLVA
ncbi:MAG: hypothetical protein KDB23_28150, partial [Planctomycetales bacterium]|nr:hypothetical protein [Planctomycetales bacterium]